MSHPEPWKAYRRSDGLWAVQDADGLLLFKHQSSMAVENWIVEQQRPAPPAPVDPNALLNDTIAHIANIWGPYEMPRFGLNARVRHIPTGKHCLVKGYMGWAPPILLYSLEEIGGDQLPELTSLSDIAHLDAFVESAVKVHGALSESQEKHLESDVSAETPK